MDVLTNRDELRKPNREGSPFSVEKRLAAIGAAVAIVGGTLAAIFAGAIRGGDARQAAEAMAGGSPHPKSRFETITVAELVAEPLLSEFETITVNELVEESYGPIRFPKIRLTRIRYHVARPSARIGRKWARIGDKVAGADLVEIKADSIILQIDKERKRYPLN